MKIFKIFAVAVAVLSMTACSDDTRDVNTDNDATVSMRYAEFSTKEGRGIIKLPIDIKGKRNGDVKLTLAVKSEYENPAVDEKNVYLTTHTIVVYPEDTFYNVEVTIVDDKDMNEPRYCDVAIVAAEGATITTPSFTKVEIKDNDSEPYDRCAGEWILNTLDDTGKPSKMLVNLTSADEDQPGYKSYYVIHNMFTDKGVGVGLSLRAYFSYDENTKTGTVSFPYGWSLGSAEFGSYGEQKFFFYEGFIDGESLSISKTGDCVFDYNDTFTDMTVQPSLQTGTYPLWAFIFGNYIFDYFYVTSMERPAE